MYGFIAKYVEMVTKCVLNLPCLVIKVNVWIKNKYQITLFNLNVLFYAKEPGIGDTFSINQTVFWISEKGKSSPV